MEFITIQVVQIKKNKNKLLLSLEFLSLLSSPTSIFFSSVFQSFVKQNQDSREESIGTGWLTWRVSRWKEVAGECLLGCEWKFCGFGLWETPEHLPGGRERGISELSVGFKLDYYYCSLRDAGQKHISVGDWAHLRLYGERVTRTPALIKVYVCIFQGENVWMWKLRCKNKMIQWQRYEGWERKRRGGRERGKTKRKIKCY